MIRSATMKKGLEHPREGEESSHMEEMVKFIVANGGIILHPVIFIGGWIEGKIKIFTARNDAGEIIGMTICPVVQDPMTGKHKWWVSFTAGEDLSDTVAIAMCIYEEA